MEQLQSLYQFDEDALGQNQKGKITDAQRDTLAIYSRNATWGFRASFLAMILTIAIIPGAWALSDPMSRNSFQGELTAFSIIGGILLLAILYSWLSYRRIVNRINKAEILHIEGDAQKSQKQHGQTKITSYHLQIDSVKFQLDTKKKWDVLQEGKRYRLHYIDYPPTNIILSIEVLN